MNGIAALNQRYEASAALASHGAELVTVGDPAGARLDNAARRLLIGARNDGSGLWDDLIGAVTRLRWRLVTHPQPVDHNAPLREAAEGVVRESRRLRGAVADERLLEELTAAAFAVTESDPPVGAVLVTSVEEVGAQNCVVVAASRPAQAALAEWLGSSGIVVLTAGELRVRDVVGHKRRDKVSQVLRAPRTKEPTNWSRRYKANLEKLASGDVNKVAEVVRDLRGRDQERGISAGEKRMLAKARQILAGGLAVTANAERMQLEWVDQTYVVGPPRIFPACLVTAPLAAEVGFLLPSWFGDRSVPRSAIADYADGAIRIKARLHTVGDVSTQTDAGTPEMVSEDSLLPRPMWGTRQSPDREPSADEVEARKVLLSGNLAIWLDDGDRIRTLDPTQPPGERVTYSDVETVGPGTYLLLRQGATERGALHEAAMGLLGTQGSAVDCSQRAWKEKLRQRLQERSYGAVVRELRDRGVKAADQARAWSDPNLVRPNSDRDFEVLLEWLGTAIQPSFANATMLRRAFHKASTDLQKQLEGAVSMADLSELEREGHLSLAVEVTGVRRIKAALHVGRVLAISPFKEIVSRHDTRLPFADRGAEWLE
jgi:hypothetical protein